VHDHFGAGPRESGRRVDDVDRVSRWFFEIDAAEREDTHGFEATIGTVGWGRLTSAAAVDFSSAGNQALVSIIWMFGRER
jgi:hypothetical protein